MLLHVGLESCLGLEEDGMQERELEPLHGDWGIRVPF